MKLWKKGFSLLLLTAVVWGVMQSFAPAKMERSKVIKKDFDAKADVAVYHQYGPLTIKKSTDGRTHLEAAVQVIGTNEQAIEEVLRRFDVEVKESGSQLELVTGPRIKNWNCVNDNTTITFEDGHKVKGLETVKVSMVLFVADPQRMLLSNKYQPIELTDDYRGALRVELYSGELLAGNLSGELDLDLKYGKAKLGSVGRAKLVVYDSEVLCGPIAEAVVSSKYSEYRLGPVGGNLTLETYDDQWRMGNVGGKLMLNDKYSEFKFGNIGGAVLQVFDGQLVAETVDYLDIRDTKYSEYKLTAVSNLRLGNVFDDKFEIGELGKLEASDSKYTEYEVGKLGKVFDLKLSFDDAVQVGQVAADFNLIHMDGKYSNMELVIANDASFEFVVDMKYGKVNYPKSRVNNLKHEARNEQLNIMGNVGQQQATTNSLKITGFDNTLEWK